MRGGSRSFKVFIPRECFAGQTPHPGSWPRADLPPVLLCHEMVTLGPDTLELAQRLARKGYAVYVPVLFGNEHEDPGSLWLGLVRGLDFACFLPEWNANAGAGTRPIADELADLCRTGILPKHPHQRLGIIGLCISGMLPVELLGQQAAIPRLTALVISQPAMPVVACTFQRRQSLGIAPEELRRARQRLMTQDLQVLGFRFQLDLMSPPERFARLRAELGDRFIDATLPASDYVLRDHYPSAAHAVLTDGFRPWRAHERETRGHFAYRQLLWFLDTRLKGHHDSEPVYHPDQTDHQEDLSERPNVPCR